MDQKETHAALAGFAVAVGSDRNMWMLLCCPNASHRKENNLLDANFSTSAKQPSCFAEVALARCLMGETFCGDSTESFVLVHIKTPFPPGTFFAFLHCSFPSLPAHLFPCRPLTRALRSPSTAKNDTGWKDGGSRGSRIFLALGCHGQACWRRVTIMLHLLIF